MEVKGLVDKLREAGMLFDNSEPGGVDGDKKENTEDSMLPAITGLESLTASIRDNTLGTVSVLKDIHSALQDASVQQEQQHDENIEREKENKEDKKRKAPKENGDPQIIRTLENFGNRLVSGFAGLKKSFSDSIDKMKDFAKGGGGFLKKLLAIGALGFIFKDLIDEWTGGALTGFIESLTGENGILKQILAVGAGLFGLLAVFKPFFALKIAFKGLWGAVKLLIKSLGKGGLLRSAISGLASSLGKGGLLRKGLSGFAQLFSKNGAISKGLGNFSGVFGKKGGLMKGLGGLVGKLGGLGKALSGKRGLIGVLTAGAAAVATGVASIRNAGTPDANTRVNTPDADGPNKTTTPDADGPNRTAAPDADAPKVNVPDADAPKVNVPDADAPKVNVPDVDAPKVNAPNVQMDAPKLSAPEVLGRPNVPSIVPDSAPNLPSASGKPSVPSIPTPEPGSIVDDAAKAVAAAPLPKSTTLKIVAKAVGAAGLKSIPIIGAGLGAIFAGMRAWQGDWLGAGAEAGLIFAPGPVGLPGDIGLAVRDVYAEMYNGMYGVYPWNDTPENQEVRGPEVMKAAEAAVKEFMDASDAGMYAPDQLQIKESTGWFGGKKYTVVDTATGEEVQTFDGAGAEGNAQAFVEEHTMGGANDPTVATPDVSGAPDVGTGGSNASAPTADSQDQSMMSKADKVKDMATRMGADPSSATGTFEGGVVTELNGQSTADVLTPTEVSTVNAVRGITGKPLLPTKEGSAEQAQISSDKEVDVAQSDEAKGRARVAKAAREEYRAAKDEEASIKEQIAALGTQVKIGEEDDPFGDVMDVMGFDDPEKQAKLLELREKETRARSAQREAGQKYAQARDSVRKTYEFGQTDDFEYGDKLGDDAEKIAALKERGFTDEQLNRNDNLRNNFISVDGGRYPLSSLGMYENVIKQELNGPEVKTESAGSARYEQATSPESVKAASTASEVASAIMPVMNKNVSAPTVNNAGDKITYNYFTSRDSGIDPASPLMGR
jgi:hypothetical protein